MSTTILQIVCMLGYICLCWGQMGKPSVTQSKEGEPLSGTISMQPPDLTDEESQANFMPDSLRCDACSAIAARFASALQKEMDKTRATRNGDRELEEGRLIEMFEDICGDREWSSYGLKEVEGVKRISYPGSEVEQIPGIQQGGGIWPRRLADMCYTYVGDHEEYGIYRAHLRSHDDGVYNLICVKDCYLESKRRHKRPMNEL